MEIIKQFNEYDSKGMQDIYLRSLIEARGTVCRNTSKAVAEKKVFPLKKKLTHTSNVTVRGQCIQVRKKHLWLYLELPVKG